ncbi:MAG: DMT family transporter [Acidimicrobiia bacterium]|nr:DMT family transporter [Acidimicrobiia bacterium]
MRKRVWTAIVVSGFGWGTEGVATRAAFNQNVAPYPLAMFRAVIAAVGSFVFLAATGRLNAPDRVLWRQGAVQGIIHLAGPFLFLTFAYQHASAGFISLLVAMVPLATAMLAHIFLPKEHLGPRLVGGFVIAALGTAVLIASGESGLATGGEPLLGSVLALGAVLCIAGSAVYARRDAGRYDPTELTAWQMGFGAVILVVIVPFIGDVRFDLGLEAWALLIFLAVGSTVIPYFAFFWATSHASATLVSLSGYVAPLVAVILGVVLLDEQIQTSIAIGGLLILSGVVIADRAERETVDEASVDQSLPS